MKFKIKEILILNRPETQNIGDVVEVEQEKNEDQLKFGDEGYHDFWVSPDTKLKFEDKTNIRNKIQNTLSNINSKLEGLMDFGFTDRGEVDIEEEQDTKYLKEVSGEINNATKEFIKGQNQAKDNLNNSMDSFVDKLSGIEEKATSAENLKGFLNKLEDKKEESTLNKIASFIPGGRQLEKSAKELSGSSDDILARYEKNAGHVKF